jgi:hypothetical protein
MSLHARLALSLHMERSRARTTQCRCVERNCLLANALVPISNATRTPTDMPGYRPLPSTVTGPDADQVRQAESRRRGGDPAAAVRLLEEALSASVDLRQELPGWLCGRLAALYRTLGRYDDEVHLLERYRESQRNEEARTRYDARLSKARTIAERKRRSDSGALQSVRISMGRPTHRRPALVRDVAYESPHAFSRAAVDALSTALASGSVNDTKQLDDALALVCAEAHANESPVEDLVAVLRRAVVALPATNAGALRDSRYESALLLLLALFYKEQQA